jgi:hypothetical protein
MLAEVENASAQLFAWQDGYVLLAITFHARYSHRCVFACVFFKAPGIV